MKKRLISLALTLALCLGLAVPAFAVDTSGLDANTRKAYYDVLTAQINKYGIVSVSGGDGLEYATLEDMDADGTPELIVICYTGDNAHIFIWTMQNGRAVQTVNEASIGPGGGVSESNIFLVRQPGKAAVCDSFAYFYREWSLDDQGNLPDPIYKLYYADGTVETVNSLDKAWKEDDIKIFGGDNYWWHEDKATDAIMQLRSDLAKAPAGGFTDVKAGAYYAKAVKWAVDRKITSGTSATTFSPEKTCSVAEILTFLWNANGKPEPTGRNPFSDISTGDYFYKAAVWAAGKGLVSGNKLNPSTPCTRAMVMEYLWKLAGSPNVKSSGYSTQTISGTSDGHPYSIDFSAAILENTTVTIGDHEDIELWGNLKETETVKTNLITVKPGSTLNIKGNYSGPVFGYFIEGNKTFTTSSSNEMVDIVNGPVENSFAPFSYPVGLVVFHDGQEGLYEYGCIITIGPESTGSTVFTDIPSNAAYASAVTWAVENGITAGTSDTTFSPNNTCTRGEIVTFLYRAMG